jgi:hypothetical protein
MQSRRGSLLGIAGALAGVAAFAALSAGCNAVLGIHAADSDDWDGAVAISGDFSGSLTGTSGTSSGSTAGIFTAPIPSVDAGPPPPPADAGTTTHSWASWPMPNPPSTGLPNPQSYTISPNGLVQDNVTGLIWQQNVADQTYDWDDAHSYCASLSLQGGGWRLPSRIELMSLVDFTQLPTIDDNTFPNTPMDGFWSGSLLAGNSSTAWTVFFSFTVTPAFDNPITMPFHVRCVR